MESQSPSMRGSQQIPKNVTTSGFDMPPMPNISFFPGQGKSSPVPISNPTVPSSSGLITSPLPSSPQATTFDNLKVTIRTETPISTLRNPPPPHTNIPVVNSPKSFAPLKFNIPEAKPEPDPVQIIPKTNWGEMTSLDPSVEICKVRDSFTQDRVRPSPPKPFQLPYSHPRPNIEYVSSHVHPDIEIKYVDENAYNVLQTIKDGYDHPGFDQARLDANPYEYIGKSIFVNRASVKMANIDAVLGVTNHQGGFLAGQSIEDFTFCDLAGAPGGFTQYIQFRQPNAYGNGISLKTGLKWRTDSLNMEQFNILWGPDDTGDLITNSDWFIQATRKVHVEGLDLAVADGGFDVDYDKIREQEFLSSSLIFSEIYVGMSVLKPGGNLVVKIFDTVTRFSADLIYLVTLAFDSVWIFKPMSSRPANTERYLVAKGLRTHIGPILDLLRTAKEEYTRNRMLTRLVETLPPNFEQWLTKMNTESLNLQISTAQNIITLLAGGDIDLQEFNLYRALTIWNLPDNPDPAIVRPNVRRK